jgi:hypothetical protein
MRTLTPEAPTPRSPARRVRAVARRSLTVQRSGMRLARGAAGVGVAASSRWLVSRFWPRSPETNENTSVTYVEASDDRTTLVWIHDYWTEAYGTGSVNLTVELVDVEGAVVATDVLSLRGRATEVVDVRELCRRHGVALPHHGQLVVRMHADALVAGRPVQVVADYVDDHGNASGVHGQYGFCERPLAQAVGSMRVDARPGHHTLVMVPNTFAGGHTVRPSLSVFNARGESQAASLDPLAPLATAMVRLDEVVDGLDGFLGGEDGHVSVRLPYPAARLLCRTESPDGTRVVNHGTIDRTSDQLPGCPAEWTASHAVATLPVALAGCDVALVVPNRLGRHAGPHRLHLRFRGADGAVLAAHQVTVVRNGSVRVPVSDLARRTAPGAAHVLVHATPIDPDEDAPSLLELVVLLERDGRPVAEALAGGGFFNDPVPPGLPWPDLRRTRIFSRAVLGHGHRTEIVLANPSSRPDFDVTATPLVRVLDLAGEEVGSFTLTIPPNGAVTFDPAEMIGAAVERLGPTGAAVITLRDTTARLYGYCAIDRPGAAAIRFDHLIGG